MLKIWGRNNSINVKKVLWIAEELGLNYENIEVGGKFGGLDTPKFLTLNPNAMIPVIDDDGFILWESNTIVRYIAAQYGRDSFWIDDPKQQCAAEKWMDWASEELFPLFKVILFNSVRLAPEKRDAHILADAIDDFENKLSIIENELSLNLWLSGKNFGVADIIVGTFIYYYYEINIKRYKDFPKISNWYQRLKKRPSYVKIIMVPIV
ncbi:glutathione binding-like protein [Bartonella sp. HY329]|uniref:glutathione S-transferase family protein n=1 Tax=unclassified Bartonella TaxID=2645622 RepID=UPI0021C8943C|nr:MULTISPECIES: glutathione binding-like protein [unclassified Bartonella]UXM94050.1 glutathione binding-like protein [Bartonella sp. HY329]UXN08372.1 glutathione binding-like protein [Bartonella sp. HY328]